MKTEISSLELYFLSKELQEIEFSRIEKIYQWEKENIIFRIYTPEGKKHLRINMPGIVYFAEQPYQTLETPPGFCTFLRKYISGSTIQKIYQKDFERILILEFKSIKYGELYLIIELIKPGNVILAKKEEQKLITINSLERKRYKDRIIQARHEYSFPESRPNIVELTTKEISKIILESDKDLVKILALDLGLGGTYSEEILKRANIDKRKKVTEETANSVASEVKKILKEKLKPFKKENEVFPINMLTQDKEIEFKTFSEAIDSVVPQIKGKKTKKDSIVSKTERMIKAQTKRLKQLEKESVEAQKAGEYIYEHYQEFENLINQVNELRKEKSFKEIKELLKKNKHFKELIEKEKKIVLEF